MKVAGTSFVKFLGFKRRSKMSEIGTPKRKSESLSLSEIKTQHTFTGSENEMDIESTDGDSIINRLPNGDYTLNYSKIQKNNVFIIPDYLKERECVDIFYGWRYIDFVHYFRDQCFTAYYD